VSAETATLAGLTAYWIGYGLWHSLTASPAAKTWFAHRFPRLAPAYRLLYNLLAVLLLIPPLLLLWSDHGAPLWHWPEWGRWLARGLAAAALAGFAASLRAYDLREFLGLAQLHGAADAPCDTAPLRLSVWHRFVRHPWYSFGLVILWAREMDAAWLVTAVTLTVYLLVGIHFEERKLIERYGEAYRRYRAAVPALIPRPWRRLDRTQAAALERLAASAGSQ